ncbi:MAG TPA: hypothetical protein VLJ86_19355 [Ramlibacter sp.]|nr:hypothetical protein [Ramlibacter sp.]
MNSIYRQSPLQSLFTATTPAPSDDVIADFKVLKQNAIDNDADAIELLINLAAGISGPETAARATDVLLDVYANAHDGVTTSIQQQCVALFELREKAKQAPLNEGGKSGERHVAQAKLPAVALYLAGGAEAASAQDARSVNIATELAAQMGAGNRIWLRPERDVDADTDTGFDTLGARLMRDDRLVNQQELFVASRAHAHAPVHDAALSLSDGAGSQDQVLATIVSKLGNGASPMALVQVAFVNTGNHWVTLVLCLNPQTRKVDAAVFDSHLAERGIETKLRAQLGDTLGQFQLVGSDFQTGTPGVRGTGLPQACGPLALLAARRINEVAQRASDFASVHKALTDMNREIHARDHGSQVALVTAERARMLSMVAAAG